MNKHHLESIYHDLIKIRNGLLDDSARTHCAYNLGVLVERIRIWLIDGEFKDSANEDDDDEEE